MRKGWRAAVFRPKLGPSFPLFCLSLLPKLQTWGEEKEGWKQNKVMVFFFFIISNSKPKFLAIPTSLIY
jgi:hypothetical protein